MTVHDYYKSVAQDKLGSVHHVPSNKTQHDMIYSLMRHFGVKAVACGDTHVKLVCPCCGR